MTLVTAGTALARQLEASHEALDRLRPALATLERWGRELRERLECGGRLLVAGNGGSAALAQHLAAELVGRYDHDRRPYSALALCAEQAGVTAIGNDYGFEHVFARQVSAHAQPGDIFLALTTSGRSLNLLSAVDAARTRRALSWAMTGPFPSPLADAVDETVAVASDRTACIQDAHQVAVHLLCSAFEIAPPGL